MSFQAVELRREPIMLLPSATGNMLSVSAAVVPPLLPPAECSGF